MEEAPDFESFERSPCGRYVRGRGWLCFYASPHLSGFSLWGTVEASAVEEASQIPPAIHRWGARPRVGLIDARRVTSAELAAFPVAARYMLRHGAEIGQLIDRLAILHRPGLLSSVAAGFFSVLNPPYPVRSFTEPDEAFAWMNVAGVDAVIDEIDRIHATLVESALHHELRALLTESYFDGAGGTSPPTLARCAKGLGVSTRSLQRRLGEAGTSFRAEVAAARTEKAKKLLSETTLTVGEIAHRLLTSEQHLSELFRRQVGMPPARWRRRR